jgi:cytochrome c oxidase subunit 3
MPHPVANRILAEALLPQFDSLDQQRQSALLGMWVFLASEVLFFGGLFMAYAQCRGMYPAGFAAGSARLDLGLGTANTLILLLSSLTMTLADDAALARNRRALRNWLAVTALLGSAFLVIKGVEWHHEFSAHLAPLWDRPFQFPGPDAEAARLFFGFYFGLTGLHAVHLAIGVGVALTAWVWAGRDVPRLPNKIAAAGLYWHLVDIVWMFAFPLLYLVDRHG